MRTTTLPRVFEFSGLSECLDRLAAHKRQTRPVSTYRLQFHAGFRFADARPLVSYLQALGVSQLYSSPILKARAGSKHGYDITDHNQLNPEIGTEAEFITLVDDLRAHGLGLILDLVPNHMGVGTGTNPWWQDVLENGRASQYADYFDIDWRPLKSELRNKILLPVLGDQYGQELESGNLKLDFNGTKFFVSYYEYRFPVDPQTYPMVFDAAQRDLLELDRGPSGRSPDRVELQQILKELGDLPPHTTTSAELVAQRQRTAPELLARLATLASRPGPRSVIEHALQGMNGTPGDPRSFDRLHALFEAQAYRLAHWRVSAEHINYRRFFDINDLVGLRMENPRVFADTHRLVRHLLARGYVQGLRIDHPDGMLNPVQYFTRVQMLYAASQCSGEQPRPPVGENGIEKDVQTVFSEHAWTNNLAPLYLLIEKILEPGEALPREWPVDGTVGYDFTNLVNGIFIDRRNERAFTNLYHRFTGIVDDPGTLIYESKKLIMHDALSSEVAVLTRMLEDLSGSDRRWRDFTRSMLRDAIRETIACFPVYRTYIDERGTLTERDRAIVQEAIVRAKRRNESTAGAVYDFLREILLLKPREPDTEEQYRERLAFVLKFQQLTGPVMAKGLEDTVCYVYNRFVSVNEVGGMPQRFGFSLDDFHRANLERLQTSPYSMLTTSTHDTKRSEDVRARLNVLSEMPKVWSAAVMRWRRANRARKVVLSDGRSAPDHNEEYLLYQTLVGTWPHRFADKSDRETYLKRIQEYMTKALHEAKQHMSWTNPNPEYVEAMHTFIARLLAPGTRNHFLADLESFMAPVDFFGAMNSLAQTLLKIAAPGVPDFYQGTELWDFSLVDPDNRRPVDFDSRRRAAEGLKMRADQGDWAPLGEELLREYRDGRVKLWTIMRALNFRHEHAELFQQGEYIPLTGAVQNEQHICAFARRFERHTVIAVVPRFSYTLMKGEPRAPLADAWGDAEIALPMGMPQEWWNVFTGEVLRGGPRSLLCRDVFRHFPVALLSGH